MPEPPLGVAVNVWPSPTVKVSGPAGVILTVGEAATVVVTAFEAGEVTGVVALSVTLQVIECEPAVAV